MRVHTGRGGEGKDWPVESTLASILYWEDLGGWGGRGRRGQNIVIAGYLSIYLLAGGSIQADEIWDIRSQYGSIIEFYTFSLDQKHLGSKTAKWSVNNSWFLQLALVCTVTHKFIFTYALERFEIYLLVIFLNLSHCPIYFSYEICSFVNWSSAKRFRITKF